MDNFWEVIDGVLDSILTPKKENNMFKVGDKVYCRVYGVGKVISVDNTVEVELIGQPNVRYLPDGHLACGSVERMLFFDRNHSTVRTIPADQVPVDTKVMVDGVCCHYAGDYSVFCCGLTSWTNTLSQNTPTHPIILSEPVGEYPAGTVVKP